MVKYTCRNMSVGFGRAERPVQHSLLLMARLLNDDIAIQCPDQVSRPIGGHIEETLDMIESVPNSDVASRHRLWDITT